MRELLRRWEALQPGRCCFVRGTSVQIWLNDGPQNIHASSGVGRAVIQAAVQEAIRSRSWAYSFSSATRLRKTIIVTVYVIGDGQGIDGMFEGEKADPAEALLIAYLDALEAQ